MLQKAPLVLAVLVVAFLALWVANQLIAVPDEYLDSGSIVAAVAFLGLPILALYFGTALKWWTPWRAAAVLAGFLTLLAIFTFTGHLVADGIGTALHSGIMQIARLGWPMALGILIAAMLPDRNLILPIAIVLVTVDLLAVFSPAGPVRVGLESPTIRPVFDAVAIQIPKAGTAAPAAQMGPADPLFLGMFFFAIHRFGMRARETLIWIVPALILYLLIVLLHGDRTLFGLPLNALPALVPIGIIVLLVNWDEFRLSKQEKAMVAVVAAMCFGLLVAAAVFWR